MTRTVLTGEYSGEELVKMLPSIEDALRMYSSAETYHVTIARLERPCCEKWRGKHAWFTQEWGVIDRSAAPCAFCPECGRKL